MDTIGVARLNMEVSSSLIGSCDLVGGVAGLCRDFGLLLTSGGHTSSLESE